MTSVLSAISRDVNMADDQHEENQEIEEDDVPRPVFDDGMVRLFVLLLCWTNLIFFYEY